MSPVLHMRRLMCKNLTMVIQVVRTGPGICTWAILVPHLCSSPSCLASSLLTLETFHSLVPVFLVPLHPSLSALYSGLSELLGVLGREHSFLLPLRLRSLFCFLEHISTLPSEAPVSSFFPRIDFFCLLCLVKFYL